MCNLDSYTNNELSECEACNGIFPSETLVYLNAKFINFSYRSLVCEGCKKEIHKDIEILNLKT